MLTTISDGQNRRQAIFFALLFIPIFGLMFVAGVLTGRANNWLFPTVLSAAIIAVIGLLVTMGINWRLGLYAIMFFVLWDRVAAFGPGGTISATKITIGLTFVFLATAILNNQLPGWWRRFVDPLVVVGLVYLIACFLSLPFTPHPEIGMSLLQRRANVIGLMILLLVAISDREVLHRCIIILIIGGTLVAIATLSEAITGVGLLERLGRADPTIGAGRNVLQEYRGNYRLIGPSGDPNFYAHAIGVPCVLAFGLLLYYRQWWKKALLIPVLLIIGFNIMGTGSRSGALAVLIGIAFVFMLCPVRHRMAKLAVTGGLLIGGLLLLVSLDVGVAAGRLANPAEARQPITQRMALWEMSFALFEDHPIVGAGPNAFPARYNYYRVPGAPDRTLRPHNSFMQLLSEHGLFAVVAYLGFFLAANISAFCAALGCRDRRLKFEAMALASLTFGFFIVSGTSNILENELFFLVFGLCGATYSIYRNEVVAGTVPVEDQLLPPYSVRLTQSLLARQRSALPGSS